MLIFTRLKIDRHVYILLPIVIFYDTFMYSDAGILSMLTKTQKESFKKLKTGELTANDRADFYYRTSKILKNELEGIGDLLYLLNELPDSHLKKINLPVVAALAMKLTEKLTEKVAPSPFAAKDNYGKYHVFRHFRVDMSGKLTGLTQATTDIELVYEPTEEEVRFFRDLILHVTNLEQIYLQNERPNEVFTSEDFEKKVASIVQGRPFTTKVIGIVGTPGKETAINIMAGKSLDESGLPNIDDIDLKEVGLKNSKKEEPK